MTRGRSLSRKSKQAGISFIEVVITTLVVSVVIVGLYRVLSGTERQQAEEGQMAQFSIEMRRVKTEITNTLSEVYQQLEANFYGLVLINDGSISPTTAVAANPQNKYGETTVYPDTMTVAIQEKSKGRYVLNQDFDPATQTVTIAISDNQIPLFEGDDLVMVSNANGFVFRRISKSFPPLYSDPKAPTWATYYLENIPYPLFQLADGTAVTAYQYDINGSHLINNTGAMNDISAATGSFRAVNFVKYFCAPNGEGLSLYRQKDYSDSQAIKLFSKANLHDCKFTGGSATGAATIDQVDDIDSSRYISRVDIDFRASTSRRTMSHHASIALQRSDDGTLSAKLENVNATPTENYTTDYIPGTAALITNTGPYPWLAVRAGIKLEDQGDGTEDVKGELFFFDPDGTKLTASKSTVVDEPYVVITQDTEGNIYAARARSYNEDEKKFEAHVLRVNVNNSGEIDVSNLNTTNLTFSEFNTINNMYFYERTDQAGDTFEIVLVSSNDTFAESADPDIDGDPMSGIYYRNKTAGETDFTLLHVFAFDVRAGTSNQVVGHTVVRDFSTVLDAHVIMTAPITSNNGVPLKGIMYGAAADKGTLAPFGMAEEIASVPADEPLSYGGRRIMEIEAGSGTASGPYAIKAGNSDSTSLFGVDFYTNSRFITTTAFNKLVLDALGGNPDPLVFSSATPVPGNPGHYYCKNTLKENSLNPAYTQGNPGDYTYEGPLMKSTMGLLPSATGSGLEVVVTAAAPAETRDLMFSPPVEEMLATMAVSSIRPSTTTSVMNHSIVDVTANAKNFFGENPGDDAFFTMLPDNPPNDTCTNPFVADEYNPGEPSWANDLINITSAYESGKNLYFDSTGQLYKASSEIRDPLDPSGAQEL